MDTSLILIAVVIGTAVSIVTFQATRAVTCTIGADIACGTRVSIVASRVVRCMGTPLVEITPIVSTRIVIVAWGCS
jgi:hypothetical protein